MLCTLKLAAEELDCSHEHIRRQVRTGRWPFYRIGERAIRIDPEEIKALVHVNKNDARLKTLDAKP
ncbi:MAG: DNA-binding protein [Deltaproteobacteria bacterium]|nr:DNA-binding protein [Deltaproteobacteria bacterium]